MIGAPIRGADSISSKVSQIVVKGFGRSLQGRFVFEKIITKVFAAESAGAFGLFSSAHTANDQIVPFGRERVFAIYTARSIVGFRIFFSPAHPISPLSSCIVSYLFHFVKQKRRERSRAMTPESVFPVLYFPESSFASERSAIV